MSTTLEMMRDCAGDAARALDSLSPTAPQADVDAARVEARAAGMTYYRARTAALPQSERDEHAHTRLRVRVRDLRQFAADVRADLCRAIAPPDRAEAMAVEAERQADALEASE